MDDRNDKTRMKEVNGITTDLRPDGTVKQRFHKIVFRYTNDEHGKSISLCDEIRGIMLQIPFEPIEHIFWGDIE